MMLVGVAGLPMIHPGDDLVALITGALAAQSTALADGDVVVITSKIVSKAEDRFVDLRTVTPSARACPACACPASLCSAIPLITREDVPVNETLTTLPGMR